MNLQSYHNIIKLISTSLLSGLLSGHSFHFSWFFCFLGQYIYQNSFGCMWQKWNLKRFKQRTVFFFFNFSQSFFPPYLCCMEIPGPGIEPMPQHDPSHCNDNTVSLACCTTRELPETENWLTYLLPSSDGAPTKNRALESSHLIFFFIKENLTYSSWNLPFLGCARSSSGTPELFPRVPRVAQPFLWELSDRENSSGRKIFLTSFCGRKQTIFSLF